MNGVFGTLVVGLPLAARTGSGNSPPLVIFAALLLLLALLPLAIWGILRRGRRLLGEELVRQGFELVFAESRWMRLGPFSMIGAKHYCFFFFRAKNSAGEVSEGFARGPGAINGLWSKNVEVRWGG